MELVETTRKLRLVGAFIGIFLLSYSWFLVPVFGYYGYRQFSLDSTTLLVLLFVSIVPGLLLPFRLMVPSAFGVWLIYLFLYIPGIWIPHFSLGAQWGSHALLWRLTLPTNLAMLMLLLTINIPLALRPLPFARPPKRILLGVVVLGSVVFSVVLILTSPFRLDIGNLLDVYERRADYGAVVPATFGYLLPWFSNVLNPLLIVGGIHLRFRRALWVGISSQVVIFGVAGYKMSLATPIIVLGTYLLATRRRERFIPTLVVAITAVMGIALALSTLAHSHVVATFFTRRLFGTPGLLLGFYFDHFSGEEPLALGHTVLRLATPITTLTPPHVIGLLYFGDAAQSANASFLADGFANFHAWGMSAAAIGVGIALRVFDQASVGVPMGVALGVLVMPAAALTNSGFLTVALTHGLIIAIVFVGLYPRALDRLGESEAMLGDSPRRPRVDATGRLLG